MLGRRPGDFSDTYIMCYIGRALEGRLLLAKLDGVEPHRVRTRNAAFHLCFLFARRHDVSPSQNTLVINSLCSANFARHDPDPRYRAFVEHGTAMQRMPEERPGSIRPRTHTMSRLAVVEVRNWF